MLRMPYPLELDVAIDTMFPTTNSSGALVAPVVGAGATLVLRRLSDGDELTLASGTDYVLNADSVDGRHKLLFTLDSTLDDSSESAKFFVESETYHLMFVTTDEAVTVDGTNVVGYPILEFKTAPVGAVNVTHIDGTVAAQTSEPPTEAEIAAEVLSELAASIAKVNALYARFYNKVTKDASNITVYDTDGITPLTTQAYTEGTTDTVNAPTVD